MSNSKLASATHKSDNENMWRFNYGPDEAEARVVWDENGDAVIRVNGKDYTPEGAGMILKNKFLRSYNPMGLSCDGIEKLLRDCKDAVTHQVHHHGWCFWHFAAPVYRKVDGTVFHFDGFGIQYNATDKKQPVDLFHKKVDPVWYGPPLGSLASLGEHGVMNSFLKPAKGENVKILLEPIMLSFPNAMKDVSHPVPGISLKVNENKDGSITISGQVLFDAVPAYTTMGPNWLNLDDSAEPDENGMILFSKTITGFCQIQFATSELTRLLTILQQVDSMWAE
jgi:hypothetical protein